MLKRKLTVLIASLTLLLPACNTGYVETKAYIFERKLTGQGKLMVCYAFNAGKAVIKDSSIVENSVVPQDSVLISYKKNNPANSNILVPGIEN